MDDAQELAERLRRSAMSSHDLEALLGVSQATVSRLRRGKIKRVAVYLRLLERRRPPVGEPSLDDCLETLRARAEADPRVREILMQLHHVMRNA